MEEIYDYVDSDVVMLMELYDDKVFMHVSEKIDRHSKYSDKIKESEYLKEGTTKILIKKMIESKRIILHKYDAYIDNQFEPYVEGMNCELYIPLINGHEDQNEIIGCLYIGSEEQQPGHLIKSLIEEIKFSDMVKNLEYLNSERYNRFCEKKQLYNVIRMITEKVNTLYPGMATHAYNTAEWSVEIGRNLKFDKNQLELLYISALLHDVGGLSLQRDVHNVKEDISVMEIEELKSHSTYGAALVKEMISFSSNMDQISKIILHHHENYDGTGYPMELAGDAIPIESRIINVAGTVDAWIANRSTKKNYYFGKLMKEVASNKGTGFDPEITDIMLNLLGNNKRTGEHDDNAQISWATITLVFENESVNVEGTLELYKEFKMFRTDSVNFSMDVDMTKVRKIRMYVNKNNKIVEFDVKSRYNKGGRLYIHELIPQGSKETFDLLWQLNGDLGERSEKVKGIIVRKISANGLTFTLLNANDRPPSINKILKVEIDFDESNIIILTGQIENVYKMGHLKYYKLNYVNITERTRDKLFKQLFKHQSEIKAIANDLVMKKHS